MQEPTPGKVPDNLQDWFSKNGFVHQKSFGDGSWVLGWQEPRLVEGTKWSNAGEVVASYFIFNTVDPSLPSYRFAASDNGQRVEVYHHGSPVDNFVFNEGLEDRLREFEQATNLVLETIENNAGDKSVILQIPYPGVLIKKRGDPFFKKEYEPILKDVVMESVLLQRGYGASFVEREHVKEFTRIPRADIA